MKYLLIISILPDLLSWGIYLLYRIIQGIPFGPPNLELIPSWVFVLYGATHSIFVFAFVFLAVYYFTKKQPVYLLPWIVHILIDIPTHSREFLGTPFLWPVSNWLFPGINWGTSMFMLSNYIAIAVFLTLTLSLKKNLILALKKKLF